jgi:hypothetical protein
VVASSSLKIMDEARQERLFAESRGRISPPEPGLYLGTSGWSYADWEGTLYPQGLPAASRLAEYAKPFATVEIDSTFYGTPRRSTAERWREAVPGASCSPPSFRGRSPTRGSWSVAKRRPRPLFGRWPQL